MNRGGGWKSDQYDAAIDMLRLQAWSVAVDAVECVSFGDRWVAGRRDYLRGLLTGLYFLEPGLERLDVDSAIGAAAWVAGEHTVPRG